MALWFLAISHWAAPTLADEPVAQSSASQRDERVPANHVLVIGIDGTRRDALKAAKTPNLDALIREGKIWRNTQILSDRPTENDTVSGPGWSSFLTGVWADKHGIQDNSFKGKQVDQFPHFFARIRQHFPNAKMGSFVDWKPIDDHLVRDADIRVCHEANNVDQYTANDKKLAKECSAFLSGSAPHVAMVYFGAADEAGHKDGFHPSVPRYVDAISQIDTHVGQLVKTIKSRPNYDAENWLVIVSTDHGGQGTGHGGGHSIPEIRQTWMIVSGPAVVTSPTQKPSDETEAPTFVVDVAVTALVHLGVSLNPMWDLDGKPVGIPVLTASEPN